MKQRPKDGRNNLIICKENIKFYMNLAIKKKLKIEHVGKKNYKHKRYTVHFDRPIRSAHPF